MILLNDFAISGDWLAVIIALTAIDLLWKGAALWKAATMHDTVWFIVLLVINSAGILPLMYLWVNSANEIKTLNLHSHGPPW